MKTWNIFHSNGTACGTVSGEQICTRPAIGAKCGLVLIDVRTKKDGVRSVYIKE